MISLVARSRRRPAGDHGLYCARLRRLCPHRRSEGPGNDEIHPAVSRDRPCCAGTRQRRRSGTFRLQLSRDLQGRAEARLSRRNPARDAPAWRCCGPHVLTVVLDGEDSAAFAHALGTAARAHGMTEIAKGKDLARELLYKALGSESLPRLDTISRVCHASSLASATTAQTCRYRFLQ